MPSYLDPDYDYWSENPSPYGKKDPRDLDPRLPPQLSPRFTWGKSSRETKANWLQEEIGRLVHEGGGEAKRIQGVEERNQEAGLQRLQGAYDRSLVPTIDDETERMLVAQQTAGISKNYLEQTGQIRNFLGSAGITGGGVGAGLLQKATLSKLGQIADTRTQVRIERAREDMRDRQRALLGAHTVSQFQTNEPSTAWLQFLTGLTNMRFGQQQGEMARSAAKDQAKASETAGYLSAGANLFSGAFQYLG